MNGYSLTVRSGRIASAEVDFIVEPDEETTGKLPLVLLHGSGVSNYNNFFKGSTYASCMIGPMAALDGRRSIGGWMGSQHFGNDTFEDRCDAALAVLGVPKAHFLGISMGGGAGVRYASLNPTKVASLMTITPMADIDAIYQANRLGLRADIGTAWGVTYPTDLPSQADLIGVHAPALDANGTPFRVLYSTADTSTLPAEVEALAAAAGITPEVIDTVSGHTEVTVAKAMDLDPAAPWKDYIDWIGGLDS